MTIETKVNVEDVLEQRGNIYGEFKDVARTTQLLFKLMDDSHSVRTYSMDMALYMIASKIARIVSGDPRHIDSWVDIAGYAQLVVNELEESKDVHK